MREGGGRTPCEHVAGFPQGQENGDEGSNEAPNDGDDDKEVEVALAEHAGRDGQHRPEDAEEQ